MPTVLCYGDSNTWGYVPGSAGARFPRTVRWTGCLAEALGDGWEVIAEGLNGRTATLDSPTSLGRNGLPHLGPCLDSHAPIDVVVIFLGTNDAGDRYRLPAHDVASAIGVLVRVVQTSGAGPAGGEPKILVVCPPPFGSPDPALGFVDALEKTPRLGEYFAEMCAERGCELLDLNGVVAYSDADGHHLDEDGHAALARAVESHLRSLVP